MKRIFALIFLLTGLGLLYFNGAKLREAHASKSWPTTKGIIETSIVVAEDTQAKRDPGDRRPSVIETYYKAKISYRYTVAGHERHSSRLVCHELPSRFSGPAEAAVLRYPVGAEVLVHYDAAAPDMAVLETSYGTMILMLSIVGVLFTLMGIGGLLGGQENGPGHLSPTEAKAYLELRRKGTR